MKTNVSYHGLTANELITVQDHQDCQSGPFSYLAIGDIQMYTDNLTTFKTLLQRALKEIRCYQ